MRRFALGAGLAIAAIIPAGCASLPIRADIVVENVTIYSGGALEPFVGTVAVREGVVVAVVRGRRGLFAAATTVDGTGLFLVPGLWDMHAHIRASDGPGLDLAAFPRHGVTAIRDLGGYRERIKDAQRRVDGDAALGPNIHSTYTTLNGKAFAPFQRAVTTQAEVNAAVDELAAAGAVQIKIHRALAPEMLPVLLHAAHRRGLAVTGHIPLGVHPLRACELGMDGIEHVGSFLEAYVSVTPGATPSAAIDYMLSKAADPLYACLAARGVAVAPTLVVYPAVARARVGEGPLPPDLAAFIDGVGAIALRLHRSGITLLSGTDTSDLETMTIAPGVSLIEELETMQQAGIPAREVIRIATANAARTLGLEARTGSIDGGKAADFLLLGADPGADVANLRRLEHVYRAGRRVR